MDVRVPYKFMGFGAMDVQFPYELIGFGAKDAQFPYELIGFGVMDGQFPYDFMGTWPSVAWPSIAPNPFFFCCRRVSTPIVPNHKINIWPEPYELTEKWSCMAPNPMNS